MAIKNNGKLEVVLEGDPGSNMFTSILLLDSGLIGIVGLKRKFRKR